MQWMTFQLKNGKQTRYFPISFSNTNYVCVRSSGCNENATGGYSAHFEFYTCYKDDDKKVNSIVLWEESEYAKHSNMLLIGY